MKQTRALFISAGGSVQEINLTYAMLKEKIPGTFAMLGNEVITCYADDEGLLKQLPFNALATAVVVQLGIYNGDLVGPVIFCGPPVGEEGEDSSLSNVMFETIQDIIKEK